MISGEVTTWTIIHLSRSVAGDYRYVYAALIHCIGLRHNNVLHIGEVMLPLDIHGKGVRAKDPFLLQVLAQGKLFLGCCLNAPYSLDAS